MGTKTLLLALILLVPGIVSADVENESAAAEACPVVEVSLDPPGYNVEPQCLPKRYAEESK